MPSFTSFLGWALWVFLLSFLTINHGFVVVVVVVATHKELNWAPETAFCVIKM